MKKQLNNLVVLVIIIFATFINSIDVYAYTKSPENWKYCSSNIYCCIDDNNENEYFLSLMNQIPYEISSCLRDYNFAYYDNVESLSGDFIEYKKNDDIVGLLNLKEKQVYLDKSDYIIETYCKAVADIFSRSIFSTQIIQEQLKNNAKDLGMSQIEYYHTTFYLYVTNGEYLSKTYPKAYNLYNSKFCIYEYIGDETLPEGEASTGPIGGGALDSFNPPIEEEVPIEETTSKEEEITTPIEEEIIEFPIEESTPNDTPVIEDDEVVNTPIEKTQEEETPIENTPIIEETTPSKYIIKEVTFTTKFKEYHVLTYNDETVEIQTFDIPVEMAIENNYFNLMYLEDRLVFKNSDYIYSNIEALNYAASFIPDKFLNHLYNNQNYKFYFMDEVDIKDSYVGVIKYYDEEIQIENGYSMIDTANTIIHEIGHYVEYHSRINGERFASTQLFKDMYDIYKDSYPARAYAKSSIYEWYADLFRDYVKGSSKLDDFPSLKACIEDSLKIIK